MPDDADAAVFLLTDGKIERRRDDSKQIDTRSNLRREASQKTWDSRSEAKPGNDQKGTGHVAFSLELGVGRINRRRYRHLFASKERDVMQSTLG